MERNIYYYMMVFNSDETGKIENSYCCCIKTEIANITIEQAINILPARDKSDVLKLILVISKVEAEAFYDVEDLTVRVEAEFGVYYSRNVYDGCAELLSPVNNYEFNDSTPHKVVQKSGFEELEEYEDTDDGFKRTIEGLFHDEDTSTFQVVFDIKNDNGFNRYYCLINGVRNINESLGIFFKNHPNVTYNMVLDHTEV